MARRKRRDSVAAVAADPYSRLLRAVADPSRRRMLSLLAHHDELPLRQIERRFSMTRPAVIKHLRVLKSCRLVRTRRSGRQVLHRLNARPLRAIRNWLAEYEIFWDTHLSRLKQQVESAP